METLWNMNFVFSILNAADLLIECLYEQLVSPDTDFSLFNKQVIGIPDTDDKDSASSGSVKSQMSDSDEDKKTKS